MDCTICGAPFPSEGAEVLELKPCGCLACPRCLMAAHARRGTALLTCTACHGAGGGEVVVTSHHIYDCAASYMRGEANEVVRYNTGVSESVGGEGGGGEARGGIQIFRDANHTAPDLFSLYAGDLGEQVLQYATPCDLCKLDSLNTHFRELMKGVWEEKAYQAYGMHGKEGWIQGTSFLRDPVYIHIDTMYYAGSPKVTASTSIIAAVSDDNADDDDAAPDGICLYSARDLSYTKALPSSFGWNVTICGPPGAEIVVTNYKNELEFRRGDIVKELAFPTMSIDGILSIGCETHCIAVIGNYVRLFKVTSSSDLLFECQSLQLGRVCQNGDECFQSQIAWGDDETHFIIHHCVENDIFAVRPSHSTITVWHFDSESDVISLRQTIEALASIKTVALADDYVVGATGDKKIHVWDLKTKEKLWSGLCDIEDEDDQLEERDIIYPLSLTCRGHMLVSSSHIGCALCVWNLKTGQLVKRYDDANEGRFVDMLPDGIDVSSISYLKQLNGFLCFTGYMNIWCFPTNSHQSDLAWMIRTREKMGRGEDME